MRKIMNKTKINLDYIMQLDAFSPVANDYVEAGYKNFNGSLVDFIKLDKISFCNIKSVLFHANQKILSDNLMREFALLCSFRAVEKVNIQELTHLHDLALIKYVDGYCEIDALIAAISAARNAAYDIACYDASCAAYYAAYYAANTAAYYAANAAGNYAGNYAANAAADSASYYSACYSDAEEKIQKEILIELIEDGLIICPDRK